MTKQFKIVVEKHSDGEEVREVRNAHAKKFNYDLQAIAADLKKQQKASGKKFVTLPPKKPTVLPKAKADKNK